MAERPYDEYVEAMNLWWSEGRDPAYLSEPWKIAFNAGAAWGREHPHNPLSDARSSDDG